jgi:hypothetical protein
MNLYEIDKAILACIDLETGELIDEDALAALQMERTEKIESVALWIKNLNAEAAACKAEKASFAEREQKAAKKVESLKKWLSDALAGQKFSSDKCAVSFRRSAAVTVFDEGALPAEYVAEKITKSPDKAAIKAAIKSGIEVPGAALVDSLSVSVK